MRVSKASVKGQATALSKLRKPVGIPPGHPIALTVDCDHVIICKVSRADATFLGLSTDAFSDWISPEADETFRDLQSVGRRGRSAIN